MIRAWLGRAPFALQVGALILLTLVAAQVMMVAVVLIMQPPRPVFYPLSDIANRLRSGAPTGVTAAGGPAAADPGRLVRQTSAAFSPPSRYRPGHEETSRALAQLLNVADDRVQLFEAGPPFPFSMRRPGPGPGEGRGGDGPRRGRIDVGSRGGGPDGEGGGRFQRPVMGDFVAGLKQMDGSWVTVSSPPEGFPSAWQMRILAWLAGCLIVVAPAGYLFANRITAPLRAFAKAAEQLGRDPRAPLMPLKGPAEIGAAALAFNEMQARIGRYVEDRTAMVGAISHDLRTPLARMRYKLEAAPDGVKDSVLSDVDQMEAMITAVLAFIRDASALQDRRRLDLLSVLEVVSDDAAMMGGDVAIESGEPMTIEADGLALQRLFANLVSNALKYGGQARIRLTRGENEAVVEISDAGPGLASGELDRVFQPFYRAESARTLEGGVGLGLSAARSIARAHGGDLTLANGSPGLIATVRLPLPGA